MPYAQATTTTRQSFRSERILVLSVGYAIDHAQMPHDKLRDERDVFPATSFFAT